MDSEFCKKIDDEDLIEKYIAGELHGDVLDQFTAHLRECKRHLEAVNLERLLHRGVRDFARTELKSKLRTQIKKHEISKYYILRYAAILIVAIMAPVLLYYQFVKIPAIIDPVAENTKAPVPIESTAAETTSQSEELPVEYESETDPVSSGLQSDAARPAAAPAAARPSKYASRSAKMEAGLTVQPADNATMQAIKLEINKNEQKIWACFSKSEIETQETCTIIFILTVDGKMTEIRLSPEKSFSRATSDCVADVLNQLNFPPVQVATEVRQAIRLNELQTGNK